MTRLEIFFGDASNALARVYARLPAADAPPSCRLSGRIAGPTCAYSRTLQAAVPLSAQSAEPDGEWLLAEAIVPDPCFWTSELPLLYQVHVELRQAGELLESAERPLGIRPLAARRGRFVWEGRPWVARGASAAALPAAPPADWRSADLMMCVEAPSDELCSEASRLGCVLAAELSGSDVEIIAEARRLARWPAVAMLLLDSGAPLDASVRQAARNLPLGRLQSVQGGADADGADFIVCESPSAGDILACAAGLSSLDRPRPIVARRNAIWRDSLADARRACDALQRELAGRGDFAGYLV
jgi:hypothetical protein